MGRSINSRLAEPLSVLDFGAVGDGTTDDTAAIQATFNASSGNVVFPMGTYRITAPITSTKNMAVDLCGSTILDDFDLTTYPRATVAGLFEFTGSTASAGTLGAELTRGAVSFTIGTGTFAVGDVVGFTGNYTGSQNLCVVVDVSGSTVTMDRPAYETIANGNAIYKLTPVRVSIGNGYINFNNKYGYGVKVTYGRDCNVHDIQSKNLGSKVVQFSTTIDSIVQNVGCVRGFDVAGDGGCGYVVRFATSNDCVADNITGSYMRHIVDCSGASRNKIQNCRGYRGYSADYLTHANNCVDNMFTDNESSSSQTAAYSFSAAGGDKYNAIIGGRVYDAGFVYNDNDGTNKVTGVCFSNLTKPLLTDAVSTTLEYNNCVFTAGAVLMATTGTGKTVNVTFNNCEFYLGAVLRSLASLSATASTWNIKFNNCTFVSAHNTYMLEGAAATTFTFNNCVVTGTTAPADASAALMYFKGVTNINKCVFKWGASGVGYIFNATTGADFRINGLEVANAESGLIRRVAGTPTIKIAGLVLNAVPLGGLANMAVTSTYEQVLGGGYTAAPADGTWTKGCMVNNADPASAEGIGWVCTVDGTPGTWAAFGTIA